jgi:hypothetical protein
VLAPEDVPDFFLLRNTRPAGNAALRRLAKGSGVGDVLVAEVELAQRMLVDLQAWAEQQTVIGLTPCIGAAEPLCAALKRAADLAAELPPAEDEERRETSGRNRLAIEAEIRDEVARRNLTSTQAAGGDGQCNRMAPLRAACAVRVRSVPRLQRRSGTDREPAGRVYRNVTGRDVTVRCRTGSRALGHQLATR